MPHPPKITTALNWPKLLLLALFGLAFGYVEAAVVTYLRQLVRFNGHYVVSGYHTLLNLGFITFVSPVPSLLVSNRISAIEVGREAATIVMLAAAAYLAGTDRRQRLGAFLVAFACWDLAYYLFLRLLDHWPGSLLTTDVYFLIPVTWIGPVVTPIVCSTVLLLLGSRLYVGSSSGPRHIPEPADA